MSDERYAHAPPLTEPAPDTEVDPPYRPHRIEEMLRFPQQTLHFPRWIDEP